LPRELYTARLARKICISEVAQCYHFDFVLDGMESFPFTAGQFISAVAADPNGKQQTRAYSIASAAKKNRFDLCINRVENGFFSNYLCDLTVGATWVQYRRGGPDGHSHRPEGQHHPAEPDSSRHRLTARAPPQRRIWVPCLAVQSRVHSLVNFLADALDEALGHGRVISRAEIMVRARRGLDLFPDAHALPPARLCRHAIRVRCARHWG